MPTNFPTSLDTDTELYDVTDNVDDVLAVHHDNPKDAIKAIEAKLGIDNSAVTTSVDYHLTSGQFMQTDTADDTTTSATYEDFAGLSMNVVVGKTSSVYLMLTGYLGTTGGAATGIILFWDTGTEATSELFVFSNAEATSYATSILKTGVTAATYTAKAQIKTSSHSATFTNAVLSAIVIPESLS